MERAVVLIGIYRTCFYICLGVMLLGLSSAVILFFKFDIKTIFLIRTGRAARQTIRKMAETNARTGRLQAGDELDYTSGGLTGGDMTTPLGASAASSSTEAVVTPQTTPIEQPLSPPPQQLRPGFRFEVTQSLILVHTQEQI